MKSAVSSEAPESRAPRHAPRVVLISTYDLGRQPFGLASPAAWLRRAGASVVCCDLAVDPLDEVAAGSADAVAFFLPMHTATRLAAPVIARVRALNPRAPLSAYGLYAAMNAGALRALGVEACFSGEFERGLTEWAMGLAGRGPDARAHDGVSLERLAFLAPDREGLPALDRYARLDPGDGSLLTVGYTESSRGCKHLCRHCPVVPIYGGRFRVVPRAIVLDDVRRQVEAGARHVTFGDPDFWNGIGHAIPLVRALHAEFPALTYDVTIKIEHLLAHREQLATLRETGCRFVTSAVESVDDRVLERLEKGHTRADFVEVVRLFREESLILHPTFVAFTPWISRAGYAELLETIAELGLIEHVAPVQLGIRLLIPPGSRLLELPEARALAQPLDPVLLCHPWRHPEPRVDALCGRVQSMVAEASGRGEARGVVFDRAYALAVEASGERVRPLAAAARAPHRPPVPFLTEPWYC